MITTIISETDAIYNKPLLKLLCGGEARFMKQARTDGFIPDLFNCDPDYIRLGVNNRIPFVDYDLNGVKYVILPTYALDKGWSEDTDAIDSEKLKSVLTLFFDSEGFKARFTSGENTWKHFDKHNDGIAYRGGSGYVYSIWDLIR